MSAEETVVQAEVQSETPPDRDWEGEAKKMGWAPKDTFKGDPGKWVDAKTYVERGEQFIPLLQHTKRELEGRLDVAANENHDLRRRLALAEKALDEVKTVTNEQATESAETKKAALYDAIAAAREENDVRKELQLREELDDVNAEIRAARAKPTVSPSSTSDGGTPPPDPSSDPRIRQFVADNPWFGVDQEKSNVALAFMNYLNGTPEGKTMTPEQRFAAVSKRIDELYGGRNTVRRSNPSKVEGSRNDGTGAGSGGGARSYNDLPAAAKAQCDKQAKQFIGRADGQGNVKYKTVDDYRKYYTDIYFDENVGARHLQ